MSHVAKIVRAAISTQVFPVINLYIMQSAIFMQIRPIKRVVIFGSHKEGSF